MNNISKYLQEIDKYIQNQNYDDAFNLCSNILNNIDPNNIEAIFKAGYCSYKLDRYDIAMMYFLKAISLEKSSVNKAMYKYYMGRCYDIFDSLEESLECFESAYKLDSTNKYYSLWLGITYAKIGTNEKYYSIALRYLSKAVGIEDHLVYRYVGYCYIQLKNYNDAVEYLKKSVQFKDDDYLSRYYLGNTYFLLQIYDKALEHLSESVKLKDNEFDTWFTLGLLYKVIDEESLSEECFEKAREIAIRYDNDIDYELECFIKLSEAQEHEYLNYLYLGICYAKTESYKNAIHYLLSSIEINEKNNNENNYLAYYWIGYINYIDSEYEEAIKYLEKSIKLNNDEDNYLISLWLGDSYLKIGNHKKALFYLKNSMDLKDNESETYKLMAKLYLEIGQKDKHHEYMNQYKILLKQEKQKEKNHNLHLKKMKEDYNNYFKTFSYKNTASASTEVIKPQKVENKQHIKIIYNTMLGFCDNNTKINRNDCDSKKKDINNFFNILFQDIENSDLYHLYSSNTEKKPYLYFDSFNIDNFLYYKEIVKKAIEKNLENSKEIYYCDVIDNNDKENIKRIVDNIENAFEYTSVCILNLMKSYYKNYDIELYFILMKLMENYL